LQKPELSKPKERSPAQLMQPQSKQMTELEEQPLWMEASRYP
jgi:hypothetical protein